ncbi:MAG: hypothetical protein HQK82_14520, partial [Desulfovibrionaceae bacterium]|nr:hypothetical protein [Desulfovibrionaceae bacterium]
RLADAAKDGQIESAARRAQGKSALLGEVERELKGILGELGEKDEPGHPGK